MSRKPAVTFSYPTELVFAAAVHAYNQNNGYSSKTNYEPILDENGSTVGQTITLPNRDLIRNYLKDEVELSEACYEEARNIIAYYKGKLFDLMSNKLNGYSQSALYAATAENITSIQEIGLIASLPKAYRQSIKFDSMLEVKSNAEKNSSHFGKPGDSYSGRIEVISSVYSSKWFRHFHTAKDLATNNVINFNTDQPLDIGRQMNIRARIKDHIDNNVTRLNYVKLSLDESL